MNYPFLYIHSSSLSEYSEEQLKINRRDKNSKERLPLNRNSIGNVSKRTFSRVESSIRENCSRNTHYQEYGLWWDHYESKHPLPRNEYSYSSHERESNERYQS